MADEEIASAQGTEQEPQVTEEESQDQEASAPEQPEQPEQPSPSQHSLNERYRQLANERREFKAEADRWRELYLQAQRQQAPQPPPPDPEAERQKLEMMGEVERVQYLIGQERQQRAVENSQNALRWQVHEDARQFDRMLAQNPEWERYRNEVEERFHQCLRNGQPRTRQELLENSLGKRVCNNKAEAVAKARKAGAANIQRQTTKPAAVRSAVPSGSGSRTSAEETLKRRLESGEYWR